MKQTKDHNKTKYVGQILSSTKCGDFEIICYESYKQVTIRFLNTGNTVVKSLKEVLNGKVLDRTIPSIYGVGVVGGKYKTKINGKCTKEYNMWSGILRRCYSDKSLKRNPTYFGCTVSNNFKNFDYFYEWCHNQKGFCEDFEIDKDLLSGCSKVYSEDTCVFVPHEINSLLVSCRQSRGEYPVGVSLHKGIGLFTSGFRLSGNKKHLGYFNTAEEAFYAYKAAKECYIKSLAEKWKDQIDNRAYEALINYEVSVDD